MLSRKATTDKRIKKQKKNITEQTNALKWQPTWGKKELSARNFPPIVCIGCWMKLTLKQIVYFSARIIILYHKDAKKHSLYQTNNGQKYILSMIKFNLILVWHSTKPACFTFYRRRDLGWKAAGKWQKNLRHRISSNNSCRNSLEKIKKKLDWNESVALKQAN